MTVVTPEELAAYMSGFQFTEQQLGLVEELILPGVQEELETYLNRKLQLWQIRESLVPDCDGWVTPSVTPIHTVIHIVKNGGTTYYPPVVVVPELIPRPEVEGRILDLTGMGVNADSYRIQVGSVGLTSVGGFYGSGGYGNVYAAPVSVEYIGGYAGPLTSAQRLSILRVAAREVNRQFDDSMTIRDGSIETMAVADERQKGWTEDELRQWDRLRRRVVV